MVNGLSVGLVIRSGSKRVKYTTNPVDGVIIYSNGQVEINRNICLRIDKLSARFN